MEEIYAIAISAITGGIKTDIITVFTAMIIITLIMVATYLLKKAISPSSEEENEYDDN